jgi:hypothetical protein
MRAQPQRETRDARAANRPKEEPEYERAECKRHQQDVHWEALGLDQCGDERHNHCK